MISDFRTSISWIDCYSFWFLWDSMVFRFLPYFLVHPLSSWNFSFNIWRKDRKLTDFFWFDEYGCRKLIFLNMLAELVELDYWVAAILLSLSPSPSPWFLVNGNGFWLIILLYVFGVWNDYEVFYVVVGCGRLSYILSPFYCRRLWDLICVFFGQSF